MSDHLPADLITRILLRLPVPALLRCRSVSKPWQALIDSPRFVKLQIAHFAATGKNAILFITEVDGAHAVLEYDDGLRRRIAITPRSGRDPVSGLAVLGFCNGLVCLAQDWETVLIWNPATSNVYLMPYALLLKSMNTKVGVYSSRDGRPEVIFSHGHGFGYDSVSDDYKVVQIIQTFKPRESSLQSLLVGYGVGSKSCFDKEFPYILFGSLQRGVFVGGAIHWTVGRNGKVRLSGDNHLTSDIMIVGFDLASHDFREVPLPWTGRRVGESFRDGAWRAGEVSVHLCQLRRQVC
ncbi:unnamed protein product [Linum trigynum]|uniref:F-box domain-containing protein n=1 Tax=Linum trigynum TaxID=586398 RepID=A0AAV2C890_9ROSI